MPRFSIVIPTYNRAGRIRGAIESALGQTHPDVEVIVCDNASTDNTAEVAREYGDRVRYHRNETNLGLWGNFAVAPGLATGEYFSWLTDDDYLRRDFAARAIKALSVAEDMQLFVCWAAYSPSPTIIKKHTTIHGPILPVDWLASEATMVDGLVFIPFNFFDTQAMPPALACRTAAAREAVKHLLPDCLQYNEYILSTAIAAQGRMAIDPWIGAIHIHHSQQAHFASIDNLGDMLRQKRELADFYQSFMPGLPGSWRASFRETLAQLPVEHRSSLIVDAVHNPENREPFWTSAPPVVREMRDIVLESLPENERDQLRQLMIPKSPSAAKKLIKRVVPTRIRRTIQSAHYTWKVYKGSSG